MTIGLRDILKNSKIKEIVANEFKTQSLIISKITTWLEDMLGILRIKETIEESNTKSYKKKTRNRCWHNLGGGCCQRLEGWRNPGGIKNPKMKLPLLTSWSKLLLVSIKNDALSTRNAFY